MWAFRERGQYIENDRPVITAPGGYFRGKRF